MDYIHFNDAELVCEKIERGDSLNFHWVGLALTYISKKSDDIYDKCVKYTVHLIKGINQQARRDTVQLSVNAKKAVSNEYWTATIYADGRIEDPMADYSRMQGGYLSDAVFGIMNLESADDVYDENGKLKVPVKMTLKEYRRNLQNILDTMRNELKARQDEFPNLYKANFK